MWETNFKDWNRKRKRKVKVRDIQRKRKMIRKLEIVGKKRKNIKNERQRKKRKTK